MKKNQFILFALSLPILVPVLLAPAWYFGQLMDASNVAYEVVSWLGMAGLITGIGMLYVGIPYIMVGFLIYFASKKYPLKTLQKISWVVPPLLAVLMVIGFSMFLTGDAGIIFAYYVLGIGYAYVLLTNILYFALVKTNRLNSDL